jgi:hypothetical protein
VRPCVVNRPCRDELFHVAGIHIDLGRVTMDPLDAETPSILYSMCLSTINFVISAFDGRGGINVPPTGDRFFYPEGSQFSRSGVRWLVHWKP